MSMWFEGIFYFENMKRKNMMPSGLLLTRPIYRTRVGEHVSHPKSFPQLGSMPKKKVLLQIAL